MQQFQSDTLWLDIKYANLVSPKLQRFKLKKTSPWQGNFRCHVCGDSQTNTRKARGYLTEKKRSLFFRCFNCGLGQHFGTFLKALDPILHQEYRLERLREIAGEPVERPPAPVEKLKLKAADFATTKKFKQRIDGWTPLMSLDADHPARVYIEKRQLPQKHLDDLYFTETFYQFVNEELTTDPKFSEKALKFDHPRVIIPLRTISGQLYGVQGRVYRPEDADRPKYLTMVNSQFADHPLVYGLDKIDPNKMVTILEGPFDSMFADNAIAALGAKSLLATIHGLPFDSTRYIVALDNDPRNPDVVRTLDECIEAGFRVVIWPPSFQFGDVNNAIISGQYSASKINEIINRCAFKGLAAKIRESEWKRVPEKSKKPRSYRT